MIGRLWHGNRLLVLGFVVFLGLALFFGVATFRHARDFDVAREQPVAAWMTPRYVAMSWDVPRDVMMELLQVEPPGPGRETLADIAAGKGIPVADYIAMIEAGIAAFRAEPGQ
jgi:hypothetical protein